MGDKALAKSKKSMGCQAVERKLVGPSYKDIAKKYANQKAAAEQLAGKIVKGGSGVWGAIPMPAQSLPRADAQALAQWVASGAAK